MSQDMMTQSIESVDPEVYDLIREEERRQADTLCMIPSENLTSLSVMQANGSVFTNRYSEGYPGARYYEGQEVTDKVESLAIQRAKDLFGAEHANVQSYSGSPANLAAYGALLKPHDKIMGLHLFHGGHLTHGWKVSFTAKFFTSIHYPVDAKTERLDYDELRKLVKTVQPKLLIAGTTAYPRTLDFAKFREIADEVKAILLADVSHICGLIAGGAHPSPVPYADVVTATTHKTLRGPRGALILSTEKRAKAIDRGVFPGLQGGPHMQAIAAMATSLKQAATPEFKDYAHQIVANAKALAAELEKRDLRLVSGGTDTHLLLVDLSPRELAAKGVSQSLARAGIVANFNTVPYDKRKPFDPSGLRFGTPVLTTRGMKEAQMAFVADRILEIIENSGDEAVETRAREQMREFLQDYPVPGSIL